MQSIQNLLTYLNAEWLSSGDQGDVEFTHWRLEVTGLASDVWSAEIRDSEGFLRIDSDTGEFMVHNGDTIPDALAALDAQCAGMLERIAAYIPG